MDREKNCVGCIYWRHFCGRGSSEMFACHYILDVGKMRGCAVEECNKRAEKEEAL